MTPIKLSGALAKNLASGYKLVPHLNQAIEKGDKPWTFDYSPKEDDLSWHPSTDAVTPLYDLWKKAKAFTDPQITPEVWVPSGSLRKTFMVGHFWHAYIQFLVVEELGFCTWEDIERKGYKCWGTNGPFESVTGSGDIAPATLPDGNEWLVDIKTMGSHDYKLSQVPGRFADKWECQVNVYMDLFDLDRAMILGVQKDSPHEMKEFHFMRNNELIDVLYDKWKIVSGCLSQDITPSEDVDVALPLRGATNG